MNILITGAKGFVGRHLEKHLMNMHNLFLVARDQDNPKYVYLDLLDNDSVAEFIRLMSEKKIDVLIHTAGELVNSNMTCEEQMSVFEHNIEITKSIIKIVQELNIQKLINCSSIAVYPNEDGIYSEMSEIRMSNNTDCMYGLGKFCTENMFDYFLKTKCDVINLRLSQIYGEDMRQDRIIPVMINSINKKNVIEVYGQGKRVSNFINIDLACEIICKLVKIPGIKGIYNVGDINISYLELAKKIVKEYGNNESQIRVKEEGIRSQFFLNVDKINNLWRENDGKN